MNGIQLISAERQRQIEVEGWTPEHDANHSDGSLIAASVSYSLFAAMTPDSREEVRAQQKTLNCAPRHWPWHKDWWKPGADNSNASRIRELVKAGALIAAEIDRIQAIGANDDPFKRTDH